MPRGGARPGSGRKPKAEHLRSIDGGAGKRRRASELPEAAPTVPVEEFDAPNVLTTDERNVWLELAPHAFAARTLTKGTMAAFILLCRNVLLERVMVKTPYAGDSNHRGMIQRVQADLSAFGIRPAGKPLYESEAKPQAPTNPLNRFLKRA